MKCDVCKQDGLKWYNKLMMAITLPMKCKKCDARYELGATNLKIPDPLKAVGYFLMDWLAWFLLLITVAAIYLISQYLIAPAAIAVGLILLLVGIWFTPHRLNYKDPVNDLVLRIQAKKNIG